MSGLDSHQVQSKEIRTDCGFSFSNPNDQTAQQSHYLAESGLDILALSFHELYLQSTGTGNNHGFISNFCTAAPKISNRNNLMKVREIQAHSFKCISLGWVSEGLAVNSIVHTCNQGAAREAKKKRDKIFPSSFSLWPNFVLKGLQNFSVSSTIWGLSIQSVHPGRTPLILH